MWLSGKESACQCRRCGFDSGVGKSPWRREWQPTIVFLPGKSRGQWSLVDCRARHDLKTKQQQTYDRFPFPSYLHLSIFHFVSLIEAVMSCCSFNLRFPSRDFVEYLILSLLVMCIFSLVKCVTFAHLKIVFVF